MGSLTRNSFDTSLRRTVGTSEKESIVDKKRSSTVKSPWKTVVRMILKNFGLIVVLLLLVHIYRRVLVDALNQCLHYEQRIAELEKFLKNTTKIMQVQVEDVGMKTDMEIAGLKSEFNKLIDNEHVRFSSKFDGRVESTECLAKDEFDKFADDFGGSKRIDDIVEMKLDNIRALVREIVENEIGKHAADGLGTVDYASESVGGMVLKHSEALCVQSRFNKWFRDDAVKMLQPSFGQPGECFPLKGRNGFVEIQLMTAIVPEAITLEHVSESVAIDRSSAPKDCRVLGWLRNKEYTQKEVLLTEFRYDLEKSNAQTFRVLETPTFIDTIRLEFMSNHGSSTHTCIYRVRVHGHS